MGLMPAQSRGVLRAIDIYIYFGGLFYQYTIVRGSYVPSYALIICRIKRCFSFLFFLTVIIDSWQIGLNGYSTNYLNYSIKN